MGFINKKIISQGMLKNIEGIHAARRPLKTVIFEAFKKIFLHHRFGVITALLLVFNIGLFFSIAQAGCFLVAIAIITSAFSVVMQLQERQYDLAINTVNTAITHFPQANKLGWEMKKQIDDDEDNPYNNDKPLAIHLHLVNLVIAFIGSLLWGFATPNWPCILENFCY